MKTQRLQHTLVALATAITLSLPHKETHAAEYCWRASWGVFPDHVDPSMKSFFAPTNEPPVPLLLPDYLLLATLTLTNQTLGYQQDGTNIVMPTNLVIETEFRLTGDFGNRPKGRAPILIHFVTAPQVAGLLGVERDKVFLSRDWTNRGPEMMVDTDDSFHLYRIEVPDTRSAGGAIRVYRDGTNILNDTLVGSGANAQPYANPMIWFGDGTDWASGQSQWRSFRHNAARQASKPVMSIRAAPDLVCWTSCTGVLYSVRYSTQLSPASWLPLFTNVVGSGDITCVADPLPRREAQRFYRVEVER